MGVVFLDASAAAKLILQEHESDALVTWLGVEPSLASSALIRVELLRLVRREQPAQLDRTRRLLADLVMREIDDEVLDRAGELAPRTLRTLDAIHLATASLLGPELEAVVTYDRRMIEAAHVCGLPVASPA